MWHIVWSCDSGGVQNWPKVDDVIYGRHGRPLLTTTEYNSVTINNMQGHNNNIYNNNNDNKNDNNNNKTSTAKLSALGASD